MGARSKAYNFQMALLEGESVKMQEHQLAMIPIMKEQAEVQLELKEKAFAQEIEQTRQINLLAQQLQPEPILMPAKVTETKPAGKEYLIYAGLAVLAFFFLRK